MPAWQKSVYEHLLNHYGPQNWWPGDTPLEVAVGAILTQNTSWRNVEKAVAQLRSADALSVVAMHEMPADRLAELIRPAGYYRLKTRRLKNFVGLIYTEFQGDIDALFQLATDGLREKLISVNGIGPETADSILLYAAERPVFVVDSYTVRVLVRHGWLEPEADYYETQDVLQAGLPANTQEFNEYHALLVAVGKDYCRPQPRCEECPLAPLLPNGGRPATGMDS